MEDGTYLDRVKQFVKDQGEKMEYTVAFGGDEAVTSTTWMQAAAQNTIPTAFVINAQGKIAWVGHPLYLDNPLAEIVAGRYEMKNDAELKAAADRSAKDAAVAKKSRLLDARLTDALQNGNKEEAVKVMDELVALDPQQFQQIIPAQVQDAAGGHMKDDKAAYEYARKVSDGAAKDSPQALNAIAWMILDDDAVAHRDYDVALTLALR